MTTTFGIEEEFVLLDPATLTTVARSGADSIVDRREGAIVDEYFRSQIEYVSPVFRDAGEALATVDGVRARLAEWAAREGVIVAGVGTPLRVGADAGIRPGRRYERITRDADGLAAEHQINGLHVHVGVPDRDAGVRASDRLRAWLPTLLALSCNSPFWDGVDTGYASWRAIHSRRWTTYGIPPLFGDADEYARVVGSLQGVGLTSDEGTINWSIRLSRHHPTVEVRVFDAQLDAESSVALAVLTRALAESPAMVSTVPDVLLDAGLWHAARYGLDRGILHPLTGRIQPADAVIDDLRAAVDGSTGAADGALVDRFLARVRADGTGAARQRRALAEGTAALARAISPATAVVAAVD